MTEILHTTGMPVINNRDEFAGDSLRRFSGTNRVSADTIEVSAEKKFSEEANGL
jgi:hypothetical protein